MRKINNPGRIVLSATILLVMTLAVLCITSCKKQETEINKKPGETQRQVEVWLNDQFVHAGTEGSISKDLIQQNLDYSGGIVKQRADKETFLILPLNTKYCLARKLDPAFPVALVLRRDEQGHIEDGNIIQSRPVAKSNELIQNSTIATFATQPEKRPDGRFDFYSASGKFLYQLVIENGRIARVGEMKPGSKQNGRTTGCTDWYWIVTYYYSDGSTETTSEYLGTTCDCEPTSPFAFDPTCADGGGGGPSAGTNPGTCESNVKNLINGTLPPSGLTSSLVSQTETTRTRFYRWTIYRQSFGLWSFKSLEKGVHVKVNNEWRWKSLEHVSISRSGTVVGGTIDCSLDAANPTVGLYNAHMELHFTIKASAICSGSPISFSQTFKNGVYIPVTA